MFRHLSTKLDEMVIRRYGSFDKMVLGRVVLDEVSLIKKQFAIFGAKNGPMSLFLYFLHSIFQGKFHISR